MTDKLCEAFPTLKGFDIPICDLCVSVRVLNCLSHAGIASLQQLLALSIEDLLKGGFKGKDCIHELLPQLERLSDILSDQPARPRRSRFKPLKLPTKAKYRSKAQTSAKPL